MLSRHLFSSCSVLGLFGYLFRTQYGTRYRNTKLFTRKQTAKGFMLDSEREGKVLSERKEIIIKKTSYGSTVLQLRVACFMEGVFSTRQRAQTRRGSLFLFAKGILAYIPGHDLY